LAYYTKRPALLVGQFSDASKNFIEFNKSLNKYISEVNSEHKSMYVQTVVKKSGGEHFYWLIDYQIPPVQNYSELSQKKGLDRKTIKGGIKDVAGLIGIKLRKSQYTGRKKK